MPAADMMDARDSTLGRGVTRRSGGGHRKFECCDHKSTQTEEDSTVFDDADEDAFINEIMEVQDSKDAAVQVQGGHDAAVQAQGGNDGGSKVSDDGSSDTSSKTGCKMC